MTNPSCNSTTDGRTVSTPQHHLPSIPALNPNKKFKGIFSTAWPRPLVTTPPPLCPPPLVDLCPLTPPLPYQSPLPPMPGPLTLSPHLSPPLLLPPFPCMGTCHCSLNETAPYHCRGTKHESLGDLPPPYLSRRLLDVGIGYSPI